MPHPENVKKQPAFLSNILCDDRLSGFRHKGRQSSVVILNHREPSRFAYHPRDGFILPLMRFSVNAKQLDPGIVFRP